MQQLLMYVLMQVLGGLVRLLHVARVPTGAERRGLSKRLPDQGF